jgi:hypothetical protein
VPLIRERFGMDMTDEQIALMVAKKFNRSTGNFLGTQITMASKLAKDTAIINKTMGVGDAYQHYMKSPQGAEEAAGAAWKNFLAVFGSVYLPAITSGLLKLAGALDSLGQWVNKNQGLVKLLVGAFAVLAGGLMIKGAVLLLGAAFRGLGLSLAMGAVGGLPAIVTGLGVAMGALLSPIGLVIAAIALLAATAYAFRPLSQGEVDKAKMEGGARLTPSALARSKAMGWMPPAVTSGVGPKITGFKESENGYYAKRQLAALRAKDKSTMDAFIAPAASRPIQVSTAVSMDGFKVASIVTTHQSKEVSRPQLGTGRFDFGLMPLSPGMNIR